LLVNRGAGFQLSLERRLGMHFIALHRHVTRRRSATACIVLIPLCRWASSA